MSIREQIVAEAQTWLGTPYHHQGCLKNVGVDCGMILVAVFHAVGLIPQIDPRPYPHDWHLHRDDERYLGWLAQFGREVGQPELGDVVVWRFGRTFSHGAIYVGQNQIIHAYIGRGVVLANMDEGELSGRDVKFFSLIHQS